MILPPRCKKVLDVCKRAEVNHREVKIRLLLELIDIMKEKHDESYGIVHEKEEDSGKGACYDYDEFFCRTGREWSWRMVYSMKRAGFPAFTMIW